MDRRTWIIGTSTALFAVNIVALSPVVARIATEGAMSRAGTGLLFTAHFLGFIVFALIGGAVSDRIGKERVFGLSLGAYAVGFALFAFVDSFWIGCGVMFFLGGCGGIIECIGSAIAADLDPSRPEQAVNRMQIFFAVGALVSPIVVSLFLANLPFWRSFYLVLALVAAGLAVWMRSYGSPGPAGTQQALHRSDLTIALRDPGFLLMCFCMFAYTGSEVGAWGWLSSLLQQKVSFGVVQSGFGVALFWLSMTIGRTLCGLAIPHVRIDRLIAGLAAFTALAALLSGWVQGEALLLVLTACMGLGCSSQFPLIAAQGSRMTSLPSGAAFSILMISGNAGSSVVPLLMGAVGDAAGLDRALLIPALLFASVAVVQMLYRRESGRNQIHAL